MTLISCLCWIMTWIVLTYSLEVVGNKRVEMFKFDGEFRLPKSFNPLAYNISLSWKEKEYCQWQYGRVEMDVVCLNSSSEIVLHAYQLQVYKPNVMCSGEFVALDPEKSPTIDLETTAYRIHLSRKISEGEVCRITIPYSWRLQAGVVGPFGGKVGAFHLVTQFQNVFGRQFFPSFDEPSFKSTFRLMISLSTEFAKTVKVTSNMPLDGEPRNDTFRTLFTFLPTPKMSPYLLALTISNASLPCYVSEFVSANRNVSVEVFGRPSRTPFREVAERIRDTSLIMEQFTGVANPVPKISCAVISFRKHPMENWGLIITPRVVARTLIHETVHQWFGNLVTMKYWNDFWLNEGFTSFYTCQVLLLTGKDLRRSCSQASNWLHSMSSAVHDNLAISDPKHLDYLQMVDIRINTNSYYQAELFLRMTQRILGKRSFKNYVQNYVQTYAYGNSDSEDLIESFATSYMMEYTVNNIYLTQFMRDFIYNRDAVLVHAAKMGDGQYRVTQDCLRFASSSSKATKPGSQIDAIPCNTTWQIPLWYTLHPKNLTENSTEEAPEPYLMWVEPGREATIYVGEEEILELNPEALGYYMVSVERLPEEEPGKVFIAEFMSSFLLALGGDHESWKKFLRDVEKLENETRLEAWFAAKKAFALLGQKNLQPMLEELMKLGKKMVGPLCRASPYEDKELELMIRGVITGPFRMRARSCRRLRDSM